MNVVSEEVGSWQWAVGSFFGLRELVVSTESCSLPTANFPLLSGTLTLLKRLKDIGIV